MKSYYYSKLLTENTAFETGVRFGGWEEQKHLGFDVRVQHAGDHKGVFFSMDFLPEFADPWSGIRRVSFRFQ